MRKSNMLRAGKMSLKRRRRKGKNGLVGLANDISWEVKMWCSVKLFIRKHTSVLQLHVRNS